MITPKLLHIKLWADWWEAYGHGVDLRDLLVGVPETLVEWFHEMWKYARESTAAQKVVAQLLDEGGPFRTTDYLEDDRGAAYFLALSEADPERALRCLEATVGTWSTERLRNFTTGRREVVWALERIAIWRELFQGGARLLLRLAEAENETWGNNASGVFAGLFSTGPGAVAPTEASPEERFPVLREAVLSESKGQRLLGLKASDAALESYNFVRTSGAEFQGLRREPKLWTPRTWGEMFDAYRRVWQLLREGLDTLEPDERAKAIDVLLHHAGGIGRYANLLDVVIDTLTELGQKPYAPRKKIIETVTRVLHYQAKELPAEMSGRWVELRDTLVGNDFQSRMERYVALDLLEDKVDEEGELADKAEPHIARLATEAVEHREALVAELPWLVREAANGFRFGYALGTRDESSALLSTLLDAQRDAGAEGNGFFLSGYFRAIRERDPERWEALLDELSGDNALGRFVPELSWRGGFLTDRAARRVLGLAETGGCGIATFRMFTFGSSVAELSERVFLEWLEFLLAASTRESISIALDLHHFYYGRKESRYPLPKEVTLRLLTAEPLFHSGARQQADQMETYHWTEVGKLFVRRYPAASAPIAEKMLEHFGEDGTVVERFGSTAHRVLDEIIRAAPAGAWKAIAKYLGPPVDSRAYHITSWLRGERFDSRGGAAPLALIPPEQIWKWINEDAEARAAYAASFVPKELFRDEKRVCLARELLVRYGSRKDVRNELIANFSSEGWSGPASLHYQQRKNWLLTLKKEETNANVQRWIDEYVAMLDREIEHARIQEERQF